MSALTEIPPAMPLAEGSAWGNVQAAGTKSGNKMSATPSLNFLPAEDEEEVSPVCFLRLRNVSRDPTFPIKRREASRLPPRARVEVHIFPLFLGGLLRNRAAADKQPDDENESAHDE